MTKNIKNRYHLIVLVILLAVFSGCGGPYHNKSIHNPSHVIRSGQNATQQSHHQAPVPPPIDIMVTVKGWKIVQHRIMGNTSKLGDIRFAGRFLFIDDLVFKLKSEKVPDWYWLVKIPSIEEGIYEIRARPWREYSLDLSPIEAPKQLKVSLKVEGKVVQSHYIVDPDPRWGYFQVSGHKPPIIYLKNERYPGRLWAAKLPREDGTWVIYITLIK